MTHGEQRRFYRIVRLPVLGLAAVLVAAVGVVLLDSRPAQAQTPTDREIWSATLMPQPLTFGRGCSSVSFNTAKRCSNSAVLTDDDFTYEGATHTIQRIETTGTALRVQFTNSTPFASKPLTLHVDGVRFAFAAATEISGGKAFTWTTSIAWTANQTVNLRITEEVIELPPPRKPPPPDPSDPEAKPSRCACTQVAAAHFPERCSKCAIIRSCGAN